jgi:hypothetical protein
VKTLDHFPTIVNSRGWSLTWMHYRLHRDHASKSDVWIIDFVDTGHPALLWMWDKRQRGYRAMGTGCVLMSRRKDVEFS